MVSIQMIGRLGKDCRVEQIGNRYVVNFNIAHSEKYKKNDGTEVVKTTWMSCSLWGERFPKISEYLLKGTQVYVAGEPSADVYIPSSGKASGTLNCVVHKIELLGSSNKPTSGRNDAAPSYVHPDAEGVFNDDVPF